MMPQGDKDKNNEFSIQNGSKVKYVMALYPKNYVTRSKTYMESFIIVSKIAQLSHYVCRSTVTAISRYVKILVYRPALFNTSNISHHMLRLLA